MYGPGANALEGRPRLAMIVATIRQGTYRRMPGADSRVRTTRIQKGAVELRLLRELKSFYPSDQRACGASNRMMSNWWASVKTAIHWVMGGRLALLS